MGEVQKSFPLFPLGLVLLPTEVVPLHIFEERYRTMIGECLEENRPFGILWLADDGLRDIGCTADVTQVMEQMEDGRSNILVQGGHAFRLLKRIDDLAYPAGEVEFLDDEEDADGDEEAAAEARESYADLVERVTDARPSAGEITALDAYGMAATIDFASDSKQALLELRSEDDRMRMVADLFAQTMKRLDYMEKAGERARSNGKVRF
ncbi:MAG: LON peptidase substrate-binding domain-containing protein [Thermoleophilaceae bacterium]|nr:LON peptidase substrate-binding domain-containing protein [Thermoleophilaceae bacterium]